MARHRNIRKLNIDEERDDDRADDDYYGRSVENEEVPMSPSTAQFIYHRPRFTSTSGSKLNEFILEEEPVVDTGNDHESIFHIDEEHGGESQSSSSSSHARRNITAMLDSRNPVSLRDPSNRDVGEMPPALPNIRELRLSEQKERNGTRSGSRSPARAMTPNASNHRLAAIAALTTAPATPVKLRTRPAKAKASINLMVAGHVDSGKSTLLGHLLLLLGRVDSRTMHKYRNEANKAGKGSFAFAWVLDETPEERARGVTMDIARASFETPSRLVNLLDAPGHKDFIPNMITGASQADAGLLVVNATRGEFETGFDQGGQTREHALILRSLGVAHLAVIVNKMDTVHWDEQRFRNIEAVLRNFLEKQTGFATVQFIPTSGLSGANLVTRPEEGNAKWYKGDTLIEAIDRFPPPEREESRPLRIVINDVFRSVSALLNVSGKVEAGFVEVGDRLFVVPNLQQATVKGVQAEEGSEEAGVAFAGDQCVLTLQGHFEPDSVSTGHVLLRPGPDALVPCTRFLVRLLVFNVIVPIIRGTRAELFVHSLCEPCTITRLKCTLNRSTGEEEKRRPRCLTRGMSAMVEIETERPIAVEAYTACKALGRVTLRAEGKTIAAGLIVEVMV